MSYFNKDLDEIAFRVIKPCKDLESYIYNYWIIRNKDLKKTISQKVLSDGNSGIVIDFTSSFVTKINNTSFASIDVFSYCGPSKYPLYMTYKNNIDSIGIRFKAAGAYKFFNEDISKYKDIVVLMENSKDFKINDLYKNLINTKDTLKKISHIESFLLDKINKSSKTNSSWIFEFIDFILKHNGDVNIDEMCKDFNLSSRLCARKFKEEVGLSAKLYARLIRVKHTKDVLASLEVESLTSLAYDNGYFDQAHFTNDFKSFMKETPKNYFLNKKKLAKEQNYKKFEE